MTDGKNEGEKVEFLDKALSACEGFFQVQAVGFGQDWDQKELMKIANKMTGKATSVTNTSDLGNLMKDALASAMSKNIADVRLRFWTPKIVSFKVFKQSYPTEIDLTCSMISVDPRTIEFPLGAFGAEAQDYFATFEVPANQNGDQCLVCRPSLVYTDPNKGELVKIDGKEVAVQWTDDTSYSMRMNRQVAHYSGQAEKAQAIQEGLDAYRSGDTEKATVQLQKAVKLARESGDDATVANIRKIAEIDDKDFSVVIKRNTTKANLMDLEVGSSRSVRIQKKD